MVAKYEGPRASRMVLSTGTVVVFDCGDDEEGGAGINMADEDGRCAAWGFDVLRHEAGVVDSLTKLTAEERQEFAEFVIERWRHWAAQEQD